MNMKDHLLAALGEQTERLPWLKGYSLAFILVASYDHHQEHFEKLSTLLGNKSNNF